MAIVTHSLFVGFCSELELLRLWVVAVRSLWLPRSAVLVKGVPEGSFWREVVH